MRVLGNSVHVHVQPVAESNRFCKRFVVIINSSSSSTSNNSIIFFIIIQGRGSFLPYLISPHLTHCLKLPYLSLPKKISLPDFTLTYHTIPQSTDLRLYLTRRWQDLRAKMGHLL